MVLCKKYNTCEYNTVCIYSKPIDKEEYIWWDDKTSVCKDLVKEQYYINYIRKQKLEKLNESSI